MTITITLPPATEARLRAQAQATGKNIDAIVVEALEARLSLASTSLSNVLAPVHEDFQKSGMTEVELDMLLQNSLREARTVRK